MYIKKVEIEKFKIEEFLDEINSEWKKQPLYTWTWSRSDRERRKLDPEILIPDFKDYEERRDGAYKIYKKEKNFVITNGYSSIEVLTNVMPVSDDLSFDPEKDIVKRRIDILI